MALTFCLLQQTNEHTAKLICEYLLAPRQPSLAYSATASTDMARHCRRVENLV